MRDEEKDELISILRRVVVDLTDQVNTLTAQLESTLHRETDSLRRWEAKVGAAEAERDAARAELARVTALLREALEDQAEFLDQMHRARMTGLGRDPDKYASELSRQGDKLRAALTTQEPKP